MSSSSNLHLSQDDLDRIYRIVEKVSREISIRAVDSTLISLGIDPKSPIEAQKDMAALREIRLLHGDPEFQRDLTHLRAWRTNLEQVRAKGATIVVTLTTLGVVGLMTYALNNKLFF